jgi:hypothetical protein
MAYKLSEAAQARWRALNAAQLVALVRAGAVFHHNANCWNGPLPSTPETPDRLTAGEVV